MNDKERAEFDQGAANVRDFFVNHVVPATAAIFKEFLTHRFDRNEALVFARDYWISSCNAINKPPQKESE